MSDDSIIWLRPEFQGRENELIHLSAAADMVGVTRSAVSMWAARHRNFPRVVRLVGPELRRTKWVVRDEFLAFARAQLNKPRTPRKPKAPPRPRAEILAERIRHHETQLARLADLAAKHEAALKRTREAINSHEAELAEDRRRLAAEADALGEPRV